MYLLKDAGGAAGIARHHQPLSGLINEFLMQGGGTGLGSERKSGKRKLVRERMKDGQTQRERVRRGGKNNGIVKCRREKRR